MKIEVNYYIYKQECFTYHIFKKSQNDKRKIAVYIIFKSINIDFMLTYYVVTNYQKTLS